MARYSKIDVGTANCGGWDEQLRRECEFSEVKSIMRQKRFDLTGTLGCHILNRLKRWKDR